MYIQRIENYCDTHGTQFVRRAPFLILIQSEDRECGPTNFRAFIRTIGLKQCGHWMMGTARIFNESITISGSYGNDGLPKTVSEKIFLKGFPVPEDLYNEWAYGAGHNSAGSEAESFRIWALENYKQLASKIKH